MKKDKDNEKLDIPKLNENLYVEIWGTGIPMREFLYVDDLAEACLFLMLNYNSSEIVNIGTGEDISIQDLAILVKDIVGSISANTAISGENIGKINILDKFTFVEIHGKYVNEILNSMKGKQIKGRDVNIEIANS